MSERISNIMYQFSQQMKKIFRICLLYTSSEGKIAIEQAKEQLSAGEESLSRALQTIQNGQVQIDTAWEELHEKEGPASVPVIPHLR